MDNDRSTLYILLGVKTENEFFPGLEIGRAARRVRVQATV